MSAATNRWVSFKTRLLVASGFHTPDEASEVASNPRHDDLYLVEFPKSGITWLCFLMANTNLLLSGDSRRLVTFYNLHAFIPEINVSPHLADAATVLPGFRMIKSHAALNHDYTRLFYLVRDPRNVMVSYHSHATYHGAFKGTLDEMIEDETFGIRAWCAHVSGWLDGVAASRSFALLKYEDIVADTEGQLKRIYRLLGFDLEDAIAKLAVERSTLQRMRSEEKLFNAGHPRNVDAEFVREEKSGGPRRPLSSGAVKRVEEIAGPLMDRLGYVRSR